MPMNAASFALPGSGYGGVQMSVTSALQGRATAGQHDPVEVHDRLVLLVDHVVADVEDAVLGALVRLGLDYLRADPQGVAGAHRCRRAHGAALDERFDAVAVPAREGDEA